MRWLHSEIVCGRYKLRGATKLEFPNGVLTQGVICKWHWLVFLPAVRSAWRCTQIRINFPRGGRPVACLYGQLQRKIWAFSAVSAQEMPSLCPAVHGTMFWTQGIAHCSFRRSIHRPISQGGTIHRIKADDAKNSDLTDKNTPLTLGSVLNEKDCQNRMSPLQSLE